MGDILVKEDILTVVGDNLVEVESLVGVDILATVVDILVSLVDLNE